MQELALQPLNAPARGLNELAELRICECQIRSCHVNQMVNMMREISQCSSCVDADEGRQLLASPASSGVH
jgi:hypothetical protein